MNWTDHALRFLEQHPRLGALPTPAFVQRALDAHYRRRRLVVEIAMLSDRETARLMLWLARCAACMSPIYRGVTVESALETLRDLVMAGAIRRS